MRLRSVFKMRISILNTATTEQMGYIVFSFFVCIKSRNQTYLAVAVSLCAAFILSYWAKSPASNVPEMECHTQETAQIIADSGVEANCAVVVARFVARPAFCIPTSIEMVLFFAVFIPVRRPAQYPRKYPRPLWRRTAMKITAPDWKNLLWV